MVVLRAKAAGKVDDSYSVSRGWCSVEIILGLVDSLRVRKALYHYCRVCDVVSHPTVT